ncbi:MAG: tetratricopeptide repeat protein, partial [Candidatus Bathyanammoxibius sp.]
MCNSTIAFILFSLILHGCATQGQPKKDKPVATKATPEWKEVSIETEANFSAGFYTMLGREWEQASEFFEKALEGDPNSERLLRYIITCYLQMNENDKALVYMRRLAEVNTQDFSIHYTLANIHDAEGRPDEAIVEYERACRSDTELVDKALLSNAFYRLAHLYFGKEQPQKGINCLNDIINLDPPMDLSAIRTELGM